MCLWKHQWVFSVDTITFSGSEVRSGLQHSSVFMSGLHFFFFISWRTSEGCIDRVRKQCSFSAWLYSSPLSSDPRHNLWPMTKCPVFAVLDKLMNLALYVSKLHHIVYCIAIYKDLLYLSEALSNAWLLLTSVGDQQELQQDWKVCVRA